MGGCTLHGRQLSGSLSSEGHDEVAVGTRCSSLFLKTEQTKPRLKVREDVTGTCQSLYLDSLRGCADGYLGAHCVGGSGSPGVPSRPC